MAVVVTALPHCTPHLMTNPNLFAPGEYERQSARAHWTLGFFLFAILMVWSAQVIGMSGITLPRAYLAAGILSFAAGAYLFAVCAILNRIAGPPIFEMPLSAATCVILQWVFYLLQPSQPRALFEYTILSLVQTQHVAISLK